MTPPPPIPRAAVRRGVSLVEILVAVSVAAFAFFPILRLYSHSVRDSMKISEYAHARELAAKTMDEVLAHPFDEFENGASLSFKDGYALPRTETKGGTAFSIDVAVAALDPAWRVRQKNLAGAIGDPKAYNPPVNELKRVTIRVSWKGVAETQAYALNALKADLFE